jgi:hypothetical protein
MATEYDSRRSSRDVAVFAAARRCKALQDFFHACTTHSAPRQMFVPLLDDGQRQRLRLVGLILHHLVAREVKGQRRVASAAEEEEAAEHSPGEHSSIVGVAIVAIMPFLQLEHGLRKRNREERVRTPQPAQHFFVRPPYNACTSLFVRMRSETAMHEDELNRYFGRYGQTRAVALESTGSDPSLPLSSGLSSGVTDYLVLVDSATNAMAAVTEVDNPDVLFVAFSDAQRNDCSRDDIPATWLPGRQGTDRLAVALRSVTLLAEAAMADSLADRAALGQGDSFVPDLVLLGLPPWVTPDQLAEYFLPFGQVSEILHATDDRSGASCGAALVRMGSSASCIKAAASMHERSIGGATVKCGVVDPDGNLVHLLSGEVLVKAARTMPTHLQPVELKPMHELTRLWL